MIFINKEVYNTITYEYLYLPSLMVGIIEKKLGGIR